MAIPEEEGGLRSVSGPERTLLELYEEFDSGGHPGAHLAVSWLGRKINGKQAESRSNRRPAYGIPLDLRG
jgi:hypothetical protein